MAEKPVTVSVVIPTYNSAHLVTDAIKSVLAQTVLPLEIIVVDDGSKDDTRQRLLAYGERVRYLFQENQGVSTARNRGIAQAKGEWVAFLDADDVWHPRKLQLQLAALANTPHLGVLGTDLFNWPTDTFPDLGTCPSLAMQELRWEQFVLRTTLLPSSVIARTDLLRQCGGFDIGLQSPEDRDLWMRMVEIAPIARLSLPLTGYRFVPGSLSQQLKGVREGGMRILQKLDGSRAWKGRWLLRRKAYSFFHYQCAYEYNANGHFVTALNELFKSLAWYPLPFHANDVGGSFARPKRFVIYGMRLLGLKSYDRPGPKKLPLAPTKLVSSKI